MQSGKDSDIFIYLVDHGNKRSLPFARGASMESEDLKAVISKMKKSGRFRKMLLVIEGCYSESIVEGIDIPGVLFITSASKSEQSFGANYDIKLDTWLADEFSYLRERDEK